MLTKCLIPLVKAVERMMNGLKMWHPQLVTALCCFLGLFACTNPKPRVPLAQLIASQNVGPIILGQEIPKDVFIKASEGRDAHSYWDVGYFELRGLRLIHLDTKDLILIMSPNRRVYQILVGPTYKTATGIGLDSSFGLLKKNYRDLQLTTTALPTDWLYRPDRVITKEDVLESLRDGDQRDKKRLQCAATTQGIPNVTFYFETCEKAKQGGNIEAILVTNPDDTDLKHVDPFMNMKSIAPCPKPRTDNPQALQQKGLRLLRENMMGDYHNQGSIRKGLPLLRDAALSGSKAAAATYVGLVNSYIHQDVIGDPLDRPMDQGAQEAMLFTLLFTLRDAQPPSAGSCEAALLQFDTPLTPALFMDSPEDDGPNGACGGQYRFNYFDVAEMEALRQQARAWAGCWPAEVKL